MKQAGGLRLRRIRMSQTLDQVLPGTSTVSVRQGPGSLGELAEQLDIVLREKRETAYRLNEACEEIAAINKLYQQRRTQFEYEKNRLTSEIDKLRAQVMEYTKKDGKNAFMSRGMQSLLETRERLVREEFERKFQDLAIAVKRQRQKYNKRVEEMQKQLSGCICKVAASR
jgi:hypothetical protein